MSEECKNKISLGMKKAHAENRAWNIGKSRWKREMSYPEKFFTEVIENEFNDKDYIRDYPFFKYLLDFAWINKKLCIEIDGGQHERYEKQKMSDNNKDKLLVENGWKVLRIRWIDMYYNSKEWISISKKFIDSGEVVLLNKIPLVDNKCEVCGDKIYKTSKKCRKCSNTNNFKFDDDNVDVNTIEKVIQIRLDMIRHIDLTKYGWVQKVADIWKISHTQVKRFVKKYYKGEVYSKNKK